MLTQLRITLVEIGNTFLADRLNKECQPITSAIDQIYISQSLEAEIAIKKLEESSTDHLPVLLELKLKMRKKTKRNKIRIFF